MKISIFNKDAAYSNEYDWATVVKGWNALLPATVNVFDENSEAPQRMTVTEVTAGEWRNDEVYHPIMFTLEHITYGPFQEGRDPSEEFAPETLDFVVHVNSSQHAVDDKVFTATWADRGDFRHFSLAELLAQLGPRLLPPPQQQQQQQPRAPAPKRTHAQVDAEVKIDHDDFAHHPHIRRRVLALESRINEQASRIDEQQSLIADIHKQLERMRRGLGYASRPQKDVNDE